MNILGTVTWFAPNHMPSLCRVIGLWLFMAASAAYYTAPAQAEPYPGCPFATAAPPNVCSKMPGVPGFTPGFSMTPRLPGTWGPDGIYTPIQD